MIRHKSIYHNLSTSISTNTNNWGWVEDVPPWLQKWIPRHWFFLFCLCWSWGDRLLDRRVQQWNSAMREKCVHWRRRLQDNVSINHSRLDDYGMMPFGSTRTGRAILEPVWGNIRMIEWMRYLDEFEGEVEKTLEVNTGDVTDWGRIVFDVLGQYLIY